MISGDGIDGSYAGDSWVGSTQRCVTLSTSEAEYVRLKGTTATAFVNISACRSSEATALTSTRYQYISLNHPGDSLTRAIMLYQTSIRAYTHDGVRLSGRTLSSRVDRNAYTGCETHAMPFDVH